MDHKEEVILLDVDDNGGGEELKIGRKVSSEDVILLNADDNEGDEELKIGMKVSSGDEAFKITNSYAIKKGFSLRKGNRRRDVTGKVRNRDFVCSKAGFALDSDLNELNKESKLTTRTGCEVLIRFTIVEDGVLEITHFNHVHNHELATPEERQFLRSGRGIQDAPGGVIRSMVQAGIKPTQSYSYLSKEVGGSEHVGFTKKDCQNFVYRMKGELLEVGDCQSLVNHFRRKQAEDPNFFSTSQVDQCNRMTNFFWRDGKSKLDYDCFGEVLSFDTTFRTNKYKLICAPFVGVNHHWKNVLFGCAFLLDETTESFVWAFQTFLQSMGNKKPKTIFTDEDKAMAKAIEIVLPEAHHRLCTWHISKKAPQHLAKYYANPEFKNQFNKCFYNCLSEVEFELEWGTMISDYSLQDHWWLKKLYKLRKKWCPVFCLDTFSAHMKSTQRSESTNHVFNKISSKTMDLSTFVHHYEDLISDMRVTELQEDYRCKSGKAKPIIRSEMLNHAIEVYTVTMYKKFEKAFMECMRVRIKHIGNDGGVDLYEAKEDGSSRAHTVQFNSFSGMVSCTCKLFESLGLLCCHALKVLDLNNFTSIPNHYILKRWTKRAKQGIVVSNLGESSNGNGKSSQTLRLSELMHEGNHVFSLGSMTESATKFVKDKLAEMLEGLEKDLEIMDIMGISEKVDEQSLSLHENSANEPLVLNPPCVKTKGTTNARIKFNLEKRNKRKAAKDGNTRIITHSKKQRNMASSHVNSHPNDMASGQLNQGGNNQAISNLNPVVFGQLNQEGHSQAMPHSSYIVSRQPTQGGYNQPISYPSYMVSGQLNHEHHNHAMFQSSSYQIGGSSGPNLYNQAFGHPNFSITSMLHSNGQIPYLSQDSYFCGLNQSQQQERQVESYSQPPPSPGL